MVCVISDTSAVTVVDSYTLLLNAVVNTCSLLNLSHFYRVGADTILVLSDGCTLHSINLCSYHQQLLDFYCICSCLVLLFGLLSLFAFCSAVQCFLVIFIFAIPKYTPSLLCGLFVFSM